MGDKEVNESSAKHFKHPGWKLLAIFLQYVVGPAVVAGITSYGIYLTNIQKQVKEDVRTVLDVREVVEDYIGGATTAVAETPTEPDKPSPDPDPDPEAPIEPVTEPVPDYHPQDMTQLQEPPPELIKRWEKLKGTGRVVPVDDLRAEYQQQVQQQMQEER